LDLTGEVGCHCRVVPHDVRVGCVRYEDKLSLRESLEDAVQQEFADTEGSADVGEVQRAVVEASAWVGGVDELHVVPRHLLGCGCEVVEMCVG